jgi:hypothetical protein
LIVNGGVSVVNEEDLGGRKSLHPLAKLGRDEPSSPLIAGRGLLYVDGLANVDGQMFVNGLINAQGYAYQGVPIIPSFQPGVSLESVLRAMQQAMGRGRNADTARPDSPVGDGGGSEAGKDERPTPAREPVQQPAETPDRVPADRGD